MLLFLKARITPLGETNSAKSGQQRQRAAAALGKRLVPSLQ